MHDVIGHTQSLDFFRHAREKGILTHSYLFSGPLSVGKTFLVEHIARQTLCREQTGNDNCISCNASEKRQHPDFVLIDPDTFSEKKEVIPITKVREFIQSMQLKPMMAQVKIGAIAHADRLNREAANALLKIVEDPPANTLLFFTTEFLYRIPQTLRSRVQRFSCTPLTVDALTNFLQKEGEETNRARRLAVLAEGCPGRALRMRTNTEEEETLVQIGEDWLQLFANPPAIFQWTQREQNDIPYPTFLQYGQLFLHDLLRMHYGQTPRLLDSLASDASCKQLLVQYPVERIHLSSNALIKSMRLLRTNASEKLILENCLLAFTNAYASHPS